MQFLQKLILTAVVLLIALYGFNEIKKAYNGSFNKTAEEIRKVGR